MLTTGLILWFIVSKEEMGLGVIKGKMIGFLILSPIYIVIVLRHIRIKFKLEMLKNALSFTLPMIPTLVAAWMLGQSDKIFIADYLSLEDVGIYSLSKRIASLIALVAGAFMLAYHPLYFEIANSDNQVWARRKLFKYNNIFILSIILISFLVVFLSKETIYLFLNERYHEAYKYIPWLVIAVLFASVSSTVLGASFQQSKKMKQDMYIGIVAAVMTVGLYFLLIRNFKLYGMISATILASITIFIVAYIYSKKKCYFIPINWKYVIELVFCLSLLYMFFEYIIVFNLIYMFLFKIITILLLLLITFMFYGKEILRLIKD
jgi:O-antigen/teichoic acid export membrane protein